MQYIAFDSHKKYTLAKVERQDGWMERECRILHDRENMRAFLGMCEPGSPVAIETVGNWYWILTKNEPYREYRYRMMGDQLVLTMPELGGEIVFSRT